jgi:hypothetical protein
MSTYRVPLAAGLLCASALAVAPGFAQIDPDPFGIGMYFDQEAMEPCTNGVVGDVDIYIIITGWYSSYGCDGWECHVEYELPAAAYQDLGWTLSSEGMAINLSTPPDFVVGIWPSLPGPTIVVASQHLFALGAAACVRFFLRPADMPSRPGHIVASEDSDLTILWYLTPSRFIRQPRRRAQLQSRLRSGG